MPLGLVAILFLILAIWLGFVTFFLWRLSSSYMLFTSGSETKKLPDVLSEITKDLRHTQDVVGELIKKCEKIDSDGKLHIQKVGLLRFNPFKDTGGDQSFILALVDATDTGIIISGLYSRSGTRWYAKKVVAGKGLDYELSEEETKALRLAKHHQKS